MVLVFSSTFFSILILIVIVVIVILFVVRKITHILSIVHQGNEIQYENKCNQLNHYEEHNICSYIKQLPLSNIFLFEWRAVSFFSFLFLSVSFIWLDFSGSNVPTEMIIMSKN